MPFPIKGTVSFVNGIPLNALEPMLVTLSGTVSSVTPEQPLNAEASIVVSEAGRLNSLIFLH